MKWGYLSLGIFIIVVGIIISDFHEYTTYCPLDGSSCGGPVYFFFPWGMMVLIIGAYIIVYALKSKSGSKQDPRARTEEPTITRN